MDDTQLSNYIIAAAASWLIAFTANSIINNNKNNGQKGWLSSGGMPSKHTALVIAVTTTTLLAEGFSSPEFAIAATLSSVVMYDAVNVRRAVGQNRAAILALYDNLKEADNLDDENPLRSFKSLGHKPEEVAIGAFIGIIVAFLVSIVF